MLVGGEAFGGGEPDEFDAFLLGVRNLALRPRHIFAVAAIEAFDRLRALAHRGADAVHRGIAAADYEDMLVLGIETAISHSGRSEERWVGKACVRTVRSWWLRGPEKKKT